MRRLRKYRDSDASAILSWLRDERSYYLWCAGVIGTWPARSEYLQFFHTMYAYVLEEDGIPLGMFTLRWMSREKKVMRFGFVIVDPSRRRSGLGTFLLEEGLKLVFSHFHAEKAELAVFEQNRPALACYKAAGFLAVPEKTESFPVGEETWTCIVMEREMGKR